MAIKGIHHVAIKCEGMAQYQKTVEFYTNILGLKEAREWGEGENSGIMLDTGSGILEIFPNADCSPSVGAIRHVAFLVDDAEEMAEKVRNAGYKITIEPFDVTIPSIPPYRIKASFCIGPAGEEVEFFQER